jgi:cell division protein FtsB
MNVDLCIWDKLRRMVVFLIFVAGVLAVIVWYLPLIRQNERMREAILRKTTQLRQEEERSRQLESAIRASRSDPRMVERLAREKLGYIKPGETRIQFDPVTTNSVSVGH